MDLSNHIQEEIFKAIQRPSLRISRSRCPRFGDRANRAEGESPTRWGAHNKGTGVNDLKRH